MTEKYYLTESARRMAILQCSGTKLVILQDSGEKGKEFVPVELHFNWLKISNLLNLFSRKTIASIVVLSIL